MASTRTNTNTNTYLRKPLIVRQFKLAFQVLMKYNGSEYNKYLECIRNEEISAITFYGYKNVGYRNREKWIEIKLYVDWKKHNHYVLYGKNEINLPVTYNGHLPEISTALDAMLEFIEMYDLEVGFSVCFTLNKGSSRYDYLMKNLGLVSDISTEWKPNSGQVICVMTDTPGKLPEMTTEMYMPENL